MNYTFKVTHHVFSNLYRRTLPRKTWNCWNKLWKNPTILLETLSRRFLLGSWNFLLGSRSFPLGTRSFLLETWSFLLGTQSFLLRWTLLLAGTRSFKPKLRQPKWDPKFHQPNCLQIPSSVLDRLLQRLDLLTPRQIFFFFRLLKWFRLFFKCCLFWII